MESHILFVPYILGVTLFSFASYAYCWILLIGGVALLVIHRRIIVTPRWTEILFIAKKGKETKPFVLTHLYFNLMSSTIVCILAVDFPSFPARLAKTDTYGFSLMDMGVGSFVALNGLLSIESRTERSDHHKTLSLKKSLLSGIPLLILGFQRLALVKGISYQEAVTEYGVHWNFFFTLALTKVISSAFYIYASKFSSPLKFSLSILSIHQVLLCAGLSKFIQNDDRGSLFSANKEGLISLFGFIPLYIISVEIGSKIHHKRNRYKSIDQLLIVLENVVISVICYMLMSFCDTWVERVSRREANAAYVFWTLSFYNFLLGVEALIQLSVRFLQETGFLKDEQESFRISYLIQAISYNPLLIFLIANLMTGLVNLTIPTHEANFVVSIIILIVYTTLISFIADFLHRKQIKFNAETMKIMFNQLRH